jgi:CheY-like chemotaxis protein
MGVRLLVADDHGIVRKGLRAPVEVEAGWEVAAEVVDGRGAVEKAQIKPVVAILDISLPSLDRLEAARQSVKSASHKLSSPRAGCREIRTSPPISLLLQAYSLRITRTPLGG